MRISFAVSSFTDGDVVWVKSIPQCTAWRKPAGLGAIGRVVTVVWCLKVPQSVAQCPACARQAGLERLVPRFTK